MPSEATVEAFMSTVESGDFVGAIEQYYHPEAFMQENNDEPRRGRDLLVAHERQVMGSVTSIVAERLAPALLRGDQVAVRWGFTFTLPNGAQMKLEEVAFQTWRGERILEEKFFYDPKQMGR